MKPNLFAKIQNLVAKFTKILSHVRSQLFYPNDIFRVTLLSE